MHEIKRINKDIQWQEWKQEIRGLRQAREVKSLVKKQGKCQITREGEKRQKGVSSNGKVKARK